ncbi:hypothetical protein AAVH_38851, partial [Aphelenchoides avenae]
MSGFIAASALVSRIMVVFVFCLVIITLLKLAGYDTDDFIQQVTETAPQKGPTKAESTVRQEKKEACDFE